MDNAAFGVGGMTAVSTLVGDLLSGEAVRNDGGVVSDILSWGPDGSPGLSLGVWGHFNGDESCLDRCFEVFELVFFSCWLTSSCGYIACLYISIFHDPKTAPAHLASGKFGLGTRLAVMLSCSNLRTIERSRVCKSIRAIC